MLHSSATLRSVLSGHMNFLQDIANGSVQSVTWSVRPSSPTRRTRCVVYMTLAFHHLIVSSQQANPEVPKTLPNLIAQSLSATETELRTVLLSNIVLSGGGSLFAGLSDRLHHELARNFPHVCDFETPVLTRL